MVLTLGFGIGANTTVFTVINTLILNPLPVPDSSALAAVGLTRVRSKGNSRVPLPLSYADLKDYQARNRVFRSLAGYTSSRPVTLQATGGSSAGMFSELVTANYFSTLGLKPAAGRFFLPDEDTSPGAHGVAVMNYATWQSRFGGAADIVGKTLSVNHVALTVIGIAPPHFIGVNGLFGPDLWVPASMAEQLLPNEMQGAFNDRGKAFFQGVGRLDPGVAMARAQANMTVVAADLAREYPAVDAGHTVTVVPVRDVLLGSSGTSSAQILTAGAGLLIVVGIVLLIACSNVTNLLLARSAARQQEMVVRLAMGASRHRLVRQLLTESVLLGLLSGVMGMLHGVCGSASVIRGSALIGEFRDAEDRYDRLCLCAGGLARDRLPVRDLPGVQGFARQRGGNAEGGISNNGQEPKKELRLQTFCWWARSHFHFSCW